MELLPKTIRKNVTVEQIRNALPRRYKILALLRGMTDAFRGLPRVWRTRRKGMATRRLSSGEMGHLLDDYRLTFRELLDDGKK